jgi:hypothetical protein
MEDSLARRHHALFLDLHRRLTLQSDLCRAVTFEKEIMSAGANTITRVESAPPQVFPVVLFTSSSRVAALFSGVRCVE